MNEDTIPAELKQYFWSEQSTPSVMNYDVIGFDVDHCLVKYNNLELTTDVVQAYLQALHEEKNYPKEVQEFDFEANIGTYLNNGIWDV
jgi:hypothetical protein